MTRAIPAQRRTARNRNPARIRKAARYPRAVRGDLRIVGALAGRPGPIRAAGSVRDWPGAGAGPSSRPGRLARAGPNSPRHELILANLFPEIGLGGGQIREEAGSGAARVGFEPPGPASLWGLMGRAYHRPDSGLSGARGRRVPVDGGGGGWQGAGGAGSIPYYSHAFGRARGLRPARCRYSPSASRSIRFQARRACRKSRCRAWWRATR